MKDEYDCKEGINIDIAIVAYQDDGESYTTGPYYSNLQTITINHNYRYEETDGTYHSYICEDCGRIENCEHNLGCVDVDDEKRYYACFECEYAYSVAHNYIPYNSCYEKCSECGYKNQIAEHDYTYTYLPNPDDTETHFAYCECGKKLMTPQEHSFVPSALADTCEFCGINRDHEHSYTYTPCGDGETHRKSCTCGYTQYQQCFGMTMPGQLSRCSMCGQRLNGGLILPLGEEDAVLPSNKEDDPEEETE